MFWFDPNNFSIPKKGFIMALTIEELLAQSLSTKSAAKKESPFETHVVYSAKGTYLGNFSLPENFSENSKKVILNHLAGLGLELRAPNASKKEITADDL
jgi:hypothetical protein